MSIKKMIAGFMCAVLLLTSVVVSPYTANANEVNAETSELQAGAAVRDITPTQFPMSQGLARQNLVGVIDPIHVRVVALNDGNEKALIVTWELGDTPAPTEFVDDLAKETGVSREAIFYCATHSHAVPDAIKMEKDDPWMQYAHTQMLEAAREAIANLESVSVGIGYTDSYINVNRNRTYVKTDGTTNRSQGYNPEGISDKELALIRFDSAETGKPVAFIVNYAVHGVVMYANNDFMDENGNYGVGVSADLPGYVSTCIENNFEDSVALWISGAAGDQNPIVGNEYFVPDPATGAKQTKILGQGGGKILELLGSIQYADVLKANSEITKMTSDAKIGYGFGQKNIPGYEEGSEFRASLHMLRFGDIALMGSSGELFCQYGLTLKEESPLENTLVVNNAATYNDEYRTYMCTDEDLEIGEGQGVKKVFAAGYLNDTLVALMKGLINETQDVKKTAQDYYNEGNRIKNEQGTSTVTATKERYEAAREQFLLGAAMEETEESREAIANCLVQIGECSVYLEKGPNGETGTALKDYVFDCWEKAGSLGNGTGYYDIGMAYIGFEIPGAGMGECLGLAHDEEQQKTGVSYLEKALELKNGKAQRYIGMCYHFGYGVEQSYEKAYECFSKTSGADLYIAKYKLFGLGGLEKDVTGGIDLLKPKAESQKGGNRTEAQTSRLILAELYYTGSYSEELYDGTVATVTIDKLDQETALTYLSYYQNEYALNTAVIDAIVAGFKVKMGKADAADEEIKKAEEEINRLQNQLNTVQDEVDKACQELEDARKDGADKADVLQKKLDKSEQDAAALQNTIAQSEAALQTTKAQVAELQLQLGAVQNQKVKIVTDKKKYSVKAGKKAAIIAIASNGGKLTYKSKNKKIAKVGKRGKITGVKNGSTKIVISSGNAQITVKVTVK